MSVSRYAYLPEIFGDPGPEAGWLDALMRRHGRDLRCQAVRDQFSPEGGVLRMSPGGLGRGSDGLEVCTVSFGVREAHFDVSLPLAQREQMVMDRIVEYDDFVAFTKGE